MAFERLQKIIAKSGIASRRKAEELIRQGRVEVNGEVVTSVGYKANDTDNITVDGKTICLGHKKVYIMMNKPIGVVTTTRDQYSRKTVLDLLTGVKEKVYPVGRLDYHTSGLILLTNDGEFTYKMTHPRYEIDKIYVAKVRGLLNSEDIRRFETGLIIDGYTTSPARLRVIKSGENTSLVEITIHEGKNRQIRKMCDKIGHPVLKLKRIAIGSLFLGELPEGSWRYLTDKEVASLKSFFDKKGGTI